MAVHVLENRGSAPVGLLRFLDELDAVRLISVAVAGVPLRLRLDLDHLQAIGEDDGNTGRRVHGRLDLAGDIHLLKTTSNAKRAKVAKKISWI